jgi:hypothetical protein
LPAAVLAPVAAKTILVEADAVRALLERIIQRIFRAGLLLHVAPGDGHAARDPEPALNELDGALSDIRATVLSWRPAGLPGPGTPGITSPPTNSARPSPISMSSPKSFVA